MAGQATQLAGNQTVIITGIGIAQTPPAAPATGLTVYPTFVFGRGAYGIVKLQNVEFFYMKDAEKLDPLNQLRVAGWKMFYGTIITNQTFFARIEAVSANTSTFGFQPKDFVRFFKAPAFTGRGFSLRGNTWLS